jgi:O-antigen ligase
MIGNKEHTKQQVLWSIILLMLTSFFISRALLSITTVLFITSSFIFYTKEIFTPNYKKQVHSLSISILFVVAALSFFNSTHIEEWWLRTLVKLPLLLLPFAFIPLRFNDIAISIVHNTYIVLVTGSTIYTMALFYLDPALLQNYNYAQVLPTILDNDHIRFSWAVVVGIIILLYQHQHIQSKGLRHINIGIGIWLFVFLHILASKTGLLMVYLVILFLLLKKVIVEKKIWVFIIILLLFSIPFISYFTVPTFKKRVDFIIYDFSLYSKGIHKEGLSDGARVLSIRAGFAIFSNHPALGTGYGDIKQETDNWYATRYQLQDYEKILPSSQFLIFAAATGVLGFLLSWWALTMPLFKKLYRQNNYFLQFYIPALISFSFEIQLEIQHGVFIFCFFASWFMYLAKADADHTI